MPEATEQNLQSFDDAIFTMTSFSAKKSEKTILLSEEKNL